MGLIICDITNIKYFLTSTRKIYSVYKGQYEKVIYQNTQMFSESISDLKHLSLLKEIKAFVGERTGRIPTFVYD